MLLARVLRSQRVIDADGDTPVHTPGIIATGLARAVLKTMGGRGANPAPVAAKVGLSLTHLGWGDDAVPLSTFTTILEVAALDRYDPTFGLKLGAAFPLEALGDLGVVFSSSKTVGCALEQFTRYFPCIQSNTRSTLTVNTGLARLSYSIKDKTVRNRTQDAMFSIALEYAMLRKALGHDWRATDVEFEHDDTENAAAYRAHFGCQVHFGCRENAIRFPVCDLDAPAPHSDCGLNSRTERALQDVIRSKETRLSLLSGLDAWMRASLVRSDPLAIEDAARSFGMSLRSFQRKLSEAGVNYSDVRNAARCTVAKCMLAETDLPVTSIALFLGYSETSAFSRAFRHQIGQSPVAFRASLRPDTNGLG